MNAVAHRNGVAVETDSSISNLLDSLDARLAPDHLPQALRLIDQAWRTKPEQRSQLASIYGRLLLQEGVQWFAAINLLRRAVEVDPRPDVEADLIRALHGSGQHEAALVRLAAALQTYAITPKDALSTTARALTTALTPGWAGLTPALQVHAECSTSAAAKVCFEVHSSQGRRLASARVRADKNGSAAALLDLPVEYRGAALRITADGRLLTGGDRIRTEFGLDGRTGNTGTMIEGWVRLGWNPAAAVTLRICDADGRTARCRARRLLQGSRLEFRFGLRASRLRGSRFDIWALLPDGSEQRLPDTPLLFKAELDASLRALTPRKVLPRRPRKRTQPGLSVVVPVYKDFKRTVACLEALCASVCPDQARIVVVDDASPEADLSAYLDTLAASRRIELLRNDLNLGFSASVNRGAALHPDEDVVLVNADVVVFPGWLQRLRAAAYSGPRIGTITPLSNDDSITAYHSAGSDAVEAARELDRIAARVNAGATAPLPVGVGFCMYIRRECWREVGALDERVFGRGYGEESDFCMRAKAKRWRHLLAGDVFVHHSGGSSFGASRPALLERSQRLLNMRHPGYAQMVTRHLLRDPLLPLRRRLDQQQLLSYAGRCVLIVSAARGGGADRFVAERCRQIRAEGQIPLILCPQKFSPDACMLMCSDLELHHLRYRVPEELPELRRLLRAIAPRTVELHHFLGLSAHLVTLALRQGAPYDAYLHDYSWFCPRITLIDDTRSYCGEPPVKLCERCVTRNGSELTESISVAALRRRSAAWLFGARRVIAPSEDATARYRRQFPGLTVEMVPHEAFLVPGPRQAPRPGVARIAMLGAIGTHKGYEILLDCARDAFRRKLGLEFVVIGFTENDERAASAGVFVTGPYSDGDIGALLHREKPRAVFLASVWPETWSYALSHAIRSGLPIVAFDLGAIAERLHAEGIGTLLPLGLPAAEINDHLLRICG